MLFIISFYRNFPEYLFTYIPSVRPSLRPSLSCSFSQGFVFLCFLPSLSWLFILCYVLSWVPAFVHMACDGYYTVLIIPLQNSLYSPDALHCFHWVRDCLLCVILEGKCSSRGMGQFGNRTVLSIVMKLKSSICEDMPQIITKKESSPSGITWRNRRN